MNFPGQKKRVLFRLFFFSFLKEKYCFTFSPCLIISNISRLLLIRLRLGIYRLLLRLWFHVYFGTGYKKGAPQSF